MDGPLGLAVTARVFGLEGPRGWAFRGVSADAGPGSPIAVEGPSGSGRTCLLLALTALPARRRVWTRDRLRPEPVL